MSPRYERLLIKKKLPIILDEAIREQKMRPHHDPTNDGA